MGEDIEGYLIKEIDLRSLTSNELKRFKKFVGKELNWCFHQELDPKKNVTCAIGAWKNNKPIGIALGMIGDIPLFGRILSLWVEEEHRLQNIGSTLLNKLVKLLNEHHCRHLSFTYSDQLPTLPILTHLLKKNRWEGPRIFIRRYKFDGFTFHPPWLDKPFHFEKGAEEFPWDNLKKSEKKQIDTQFDQMHFEASLYPFGKEEKIIEPLNSLGLRYNGEIIGWMITHRIAPDTIRYSSLCIQKDHLFGYNWIKLLVDSINLQRKSPIQWAIFEINLQQIESGWDHFVLRKLAPYAVSHDCDLQSWISNPLS